MNCEEALKRLYEVIDKEAEKTSIEEVHKHLESCQGCMSRYEFEKMFKTFVTEKAASQHEHPNLKKNILEQIDVMEKKRAGLISSPFKFSWVILSAAAAFIICIVAAFSAADLYRHHTYIAPFERAHMNNAFGSEADIKYASFNGMTEAGSFIANDMHLTMKDGRSCEVVDGCCCNIKNNKFSHLRLIYENQYVSLLIGKADGINLPGFEKLIINNKEYYYHSCSHCSMLYRILDDAVIIAISENTELDLLPVINTFNTI
jgi:anti-sigma factor (TIGR02949 family)